MGNNYKGSEYPGGWPAGYSPLDELGFDEADLVASSASLQNGLTAATNTEYPYSKQDEQPSLPISDNIDLGEN